MPVQVRCPNPGCGKTIKLANSFSGGLIRCAECGRSLKARRIQPPEQDASVPTDTIHREQIVATVDWQAPAESLDSTNVLAIIGRFRALALLGTGAFGVVYRAHDPQLDREVALKVPHPGRLDQPNYIKRFFREARAAASLHHPNIVPVYEAGMDGDTLYIASEFIAGKTLARACSQTRLEPRLAARIVRELADALDYAHSRRIVHRDVKPDNVVLDGNDHAHLMDFGIAYCQDDEQLTHEGVLIGTPAYMAPEQAKGKAGEPLPASDQYALGVVFYELLCGVLPFSGKTKALLFHVMNTEPTPLRQIDPKVPRDLETICLKAMAKSDKERYASCAEMANDLRRWQEGEPIHARRPTWTERVIRWCRREPKLVLAAAMLLLCLLAVSAISTWSWLIVEDSATATRQALADKEEVVKQLQEARWQKLKEAEKRKLLGDIFHKHKGELAEEKRTRVALLRKLQSTLAGVQRGNLESGKTTLETFAVPPGFEEVAQLSAEVKRFVQMHVSRQSELQRLTQALAKMHKDRPGFAKAQQQYQKIRQDLDAGDLAAAQNAAKSLGSLLGLKPDEAVSLEASFAKLRKPFVQQAVVDALAEEIKQRNQKAKMEFNQAILNGNRLAQKKQWAAATDAYARACFLAPADVQLQQQAMTLWQQAKTYWLASERGGKASVPLAKTTWVGAEDLPGFDKLWFRFLPNNRVTMIDAKRTISGAFLCTGNQVLILFTGDNERTLYRGTVTKGIMRGIATGDTGSWRWRVALKK